MSSKAAKPKKVAKAKSPLVDDDYSPPEGETDDQKVRQRLKRSQPEMMPKSEHSRNLIGLVIDRLSELETFDSFDEKMVKREIAFCLKYLKEVQSKI